MHLSTGQVLHNRYRIVKLLGKGGFGAVYRAWDLSLKRACALKENWQLSPEGRRQFFLEASILSNLSHPSLPRVIDYFEAGGIQYLVMDFIEGESLEVARTRGGALPLDQVMAWGQQICNALTYLHTQPKPIIHRDIKPENVIILPPGPTQPYGRAVLVDFGIAKVHATGRVTNTGARGWGTEGYAPIEQYSQRGTDARSDIYSLAATLYAVLTGQIPVGSMDRQTGQSLTPPRQLNPAIPPRVEAATMKAMAIQPDDRFQTVAKFCRELSRPEFPPTKPLHPRPGFRTKLRPVLWAALTAMVVMTLAAIVTGLAIWWPRLTANPVVIVLTTTTPVEVSVTLAATTPPAISTVISQPISATFTPTPKSPASTSSPSPGPAHTPTFTPSSFPSDTPSPDSGSQTNGLPSGLIAFQSDRDGSEGKHDIYTMNVDGTDVTRLTFGPGDDRATDWSSNGKRIAYQGFETDYEIYFIKLDKLEPIQVTFNDCHDYSPVWSPDDTQFAFYSPCDGNKEIYTIGVDGKNRRQLTHTSGCNNRFPSWSPDGQRITYSSDCGGGGHHVYIMNADGSNQRKLTSGCGSWYSDDGSMILFNSLCLAYGDVKIMNADGTGVRTITQGARTRNPVFSPDGQWILFQSDRTGNSEIYLMDVDGNNQTRLTNNPANDGVPVWQP